MSSTEPKHAADAKAPVTAFGVTDTNGTAQVCLDQAEGLMKEILAGNNRKHDLKARRILSLCSQILGVAEEIVDVYPVAKAAVMSFKAVIQLEMQRFENDEKIVFVWYYMARLIYCMRYLSQEIDAVGDGITKLLQDELEAIDALIADFGRFSCTYYDDSRKTFRICYSSKYKKKLQKYADNIEARKQSLESLLSYRSTKQIHETHVQVAGMSLDMHAVLSALEDIRTVQDKQALMYMAQHGGSDAVVQSDEHLTKLAKIYGEKIDDSLKMRVREDLDQLLADAFRQSSKEIDNAIDSVKQDIADSTETLINRLDAGPHDNIENVDVKKVWKESEWRMSVKSRIFVDAIHDYFRAQFWDIKKTTQKPPPDMWTLRILSKVMYHGAIADAIDADGSGYLSVHEVNRFLRALPTGWSIPQWLAFWAKGWHDNTIQCHRELLKAVPAIQDAAALCQESSQEQIEEYLKVLAFVKPVFLDSFERDATQHSRPGDASEQILTLDCLRGEYMVSENNRITTMLASVQWTFEDKHDFRNAMKGIRRARRIELSIMPLLVILLEHHREVFVTAQTEIVDAAEFRAMARTLLTLFYAFNDRMFDLIHGWKQQRREVSLQMDCFAGGLYKGWYKELQKTGNPLGKLRKLWNTNDDDIHGIRLETDKIDQLMKQVASLETEVRGLVEIVKDSPVFLKPTSATSDDGAPNDGKAAN
ncbi:hypothetical protein PLICRDRAFT_32178 [Plicaturopsis crispa FD-325 SS-3]|uniref:Unplaced genomic scaffold PLICRscaffold_16, whole genome shotgun sequence n=1 Tax=Plicaturopsis crispa FD-325 SS-3 TaxID=944288 RepID=A0A0C9T6K0_PLICR|nr:hypothetical protein PLICRDRAFT_32178 [Plicaturopsis crispa FD-325 SS-3]